MAEATRSKVKYITKEQSLIGNEIFGAGVEVEYDGLPAENLIPTDDEGRARYQEYLDSNKARVAAMIDQNKDGVGDPAAFMAALLTQQREDNDARDERMASMIGQGIAAALAQFFPQGIQSAPAADGSTVPVDVAAVATDAAAITKRTKA